MNVVFSLLMLLGVLFGLHVGMGTGLVEIARSTASVKQKRVLWMLAAVETGCWIVALLAGARLFDVLGLEVGGSAVGDRLGSIGGLSDTVTQLLTSMGVGILMRAMRANWLLRNVA